MSEITCRMMRANQIKVGMVVGWPGYRGWCEVAETNHQEHMAAVRITDCRWWAKPTFALDLIPVQHEVNDPE